ncbi:MAG: sensor histidine kinase [Candidatus Methylomirabilia bacterium]
MNTRISDGATDFGDLGAIRAPEGAVRILLAEDSPTQAELVRHILEQAGYEVDVAENGVQALELLRAHRPALVISDILMPVMNGYELCRRIRSASATADLPVILLTSLSDTTDVMEALSCGADSFVTKPANREYLLSHIGQMLAAASRPLLPGVLGKGVEIIVEGKPLSVATDPRRNITMLISTYEAAVQRNIELARTQEELQSLNERLEDMVADRTIALSAEVNERRHAEEQLRELSRDLELRVEDRTSRLQAANEELESFSYSVSHDLRAPLRAIEGFLGIIAEDYADRLDDEGRRLFALTRVNAKKMDRLITDILELSRVSRSELRHERIDMQALAEEVYRELAAPEVQSSFTFSVGPLPEGCGDPRLIRQVWVNLIANAVKYSMKGETRRIEIGGHSAAGQSTWFVRDEGVGFDQEYAGKLFGAFQRLHGSEFEGTGVGLAIVQRIVRRHGGTVSGEGRPGRGATFTFSLPDRSPEDKSSCSPIDKGGAGV